MPTPKAVVSLAAALALALPPLLAPAVAGTPPAAMSSSRLQAIAEEACDYAFPLVLMDLTRRLQTSEGGPNGANMRAPINSFRHLKAFPPGDFKDIVRPNFDTLYSNAWLDLRKEPIILSVGDTKGRYYMLPLYDMWTDIFANPSSETLGPQGGEFAIAAPGWRGSVPSGVQLIQAPTPFVWIIGRVQTNGPADYAFVHSIQAAFHLTPLSQRGRPSPPEPLAPQDPNLDPKTPPPVQVAGMSAQAYFAAALRLMGENPPHTVDQPMLARMRLIGLEPGGTLDFDRLPADTRAALEKAKREAPLRILNYARNSGQNRQGWRVMTVSIGSYGADYLQRAAVALGGLGANRPNDAIYPRSDVDSDGRPLDGRNAYVVHFKAGESPPVGAFWSLTAYDQNGFTVPNAAGRYALGDRDALKTNADGSLDLFLQNADPGPERSANWLPIAPGPVSLNLRLYLPKPAALNGTWPLPLIRRID